MSTSLERTSEARASNPTAMPNHNVVIDCGWGRLLMGQTFEDCTLLIQALRAEAADTRDIAFYVKDPHVVLAHAPLELFLDPSHSYRLDLSAYKPHLAQTRGFTVRAFATRADAEQINVIYARRNMVPVSPDFLCESAAQGILTYLVAMEGDRVIGAVTGVDHALAFNDPERGASLWCLAVDPTTANRGVGRALTHALATHYKKRDASFLDLSVMHDNKPAIAIYEDIGFERIPLFAIKRKNPINERLFTGPADDAELNPYARIIIKEARRRGIQVEIIDAEGGFFRLTFGGRTMRCRESLSELTSAVSLAMCDDKSATRRIVSAAGVSVPEQVDAEEHDGARGLLERHGSVVVKPARGEQGRGIAVGIETLDALDSSVKAARVVCDKVLIEQCVAGEDLRLIVIDYKLVAAAVRRPPRVVGDGRSTVRELIEAQSNRRSAATGGESIIPIDAECERCLGAIGYTLDAVPAEGVEFAVRRTANLHTGGTIHDVTAELHPNLAAGAVAAARALEIPVVGIDFMVRSPTEPDYAFIEANERPGLANHEPQPTAERFIDLLFPMSMPATQRESSR